MSSSTPHPHASTSSIPHLSPLSTTQPITHVNGFSTTLSPSNQPAQIGYTGPIPFERIDINGIKKELQDALGDDGLRYWKAVSGYLLGQIGRQELGEMVKGWLRGRKIQLHNRLLSALLYNASSPSTTNSISSPAAAKRRRIGIEGDIDNDESYIEPKESVKSWIRMLGGRDRARILRLTMNRDEEEEEDENAEYEGELVGEYVPVDRNRGGGLGYSSYNTQIAMASSSRQIPSSQQLSQRLTSVARDYRLGVQENVAEVGEFMAVGVDASLGEILHGVVHLTGRDRPGLGTIRIPKGKKRKSNTDRLNGMDVDDDHVNGAIDEESDIEGEREDDGIPPPTLSTLQSLFTIAPGVYPHISLEVYKLQTGLSMIEAELNRPPELIKRSYTPSPPKKPITLPIGNGITNGIEASPSKPARPQQLPIENNKQSPSTNTIALTNHTPNHSRVPTQTNGNTELESDQGDKLDSLTQTLLSSGLLKMDKKGKHNLHWKYEDPALILRDILG